MTRPAFPTAPTGPARERMTRALGVLVATDRTPPCAGSDAWVSDDAQERRTAAGLCLHCAVLTECDAAAEEAGERWGVWAGVDRDPKASPDLGPNHNRKENPR